MADPKARFGITADDQTKAAIASVKSGLKSIESSSKATARGINASLGILAGASLKNIFRNVLDATAKSAEGQKGFAQALDETKRAASSLLAAKDGLPAATESMKELAGILKDPAVVGAADSLFSTMIVGATKLVGLLAQTAAGLRIIAGGSGGNKAVDIDNQLRSNVEAQKRILSSTGGREPVAGSGFAQDLARLRAEQKDLERKFEAAVSEVTKAAVTGKTGEGSGMKRFNMERALAEFKENSKYLEDQVDETFEDLVFRGRAAMDTQKNAAESFQDDLKKMSEAGEKAGKFLEEHSADWVENFAKSQKEMSVYAEQAARNIQDAFADFLFDPFQDGIKGMLKGFVDVIRRIAAETAAAKLFGSKASGGAGLGDFISGIVGGVFGGARASGGPVGAGKSYLVGEKGPEILTMGGNGYVSPNAGGVVINQYMDNRGATQELQKALPAIMRQNNESLKAEISGLIRGGAFS